MNKLHAVRPVLMIMGIFSALGVVVIGALWAPSSEGGPIGGERGYWEARAHEDVDCSLEQAQNEDLEIVCAEWCLEGGLGTGTYCCMEGRLIGSSRVTDCLQLVAPY